MRNSSTIEDVKIPYPSEGVIRTASIDDTVAPQDSVQSAVNLNFDQIGAIKTRLGLTEYADDLTGEIQNFGELNNSILQDGYEILFKYPPSDNFTLTEAGYISALKVDDTHVIIFWQDDASGDGMVQVVEVNPDSGALTVIGTALTFDAAGGAFNSSCQIDSTHFINFWQGASNDGFVQVFTVDLITFAVTANGSSFEFDTTNYQGGSCVLIDSTHVSMFWDRGGANGIIAETFLISGAFAVTAIGSSITVDSGGDEVSAVMVDADHVLLFWDAASTGEAQVAYVDLGTFVISMVGSSFEFDAATAESNSCQQVDSTHFINFWASTSNVGKAQVFSVDLGTYAVTADGTAITYEAGTVDGNSSVATGDGEHFVNFWKGADDEGYSQMFNVDTGTFAVTAIENLVNFGTLADGSPDQNSAVFLSNYRIANFWVKDESPSDGTGVGALFALQGSVIVSNYLYAQQGNADVYNWEGSAWTSRRTGLKNNQKARFTQYLNYIWMVNGNATIGDPVQTSNGGAFGTDLVPDNFPPGDFIQAGFEGRVWVADKLLDVVYFTDIVQFTPPNSYELTYNPLDNYIKNFSPQNGQTITGFITTPRALLLFKQDSIYRIYGAYNVDAYPAYNVGTYSEESIVQTKDGLFFHHSSGFYQFNYGGEPIEISRRVIDFVQAIPRAYYESVEAVYDGFDAVLWSVGPITVEGVTYSNCVMRYTISTQVWTIYDYPGNDIRALINYNDGTAKNVLMGTDTGKVSKMDDGFDDLGEIINFEMIDRWRSYTNMYAEVKSLNGLSVYHDNGAGVSLEYQNKKQGVNTWESIGTLSEESNSLFPNFETEQSNVSRLRLVGTTKGEPIIIHGIEVLKVDVHGYDKN